MAFTYLIGWPEHNMWYYGVRFAKGCDPSDLWSKYFTSSKYVHQFREQYGDPSVIQVRKVFADSNKARDWESRVLRRIEAVKSNKWFNRTDNKAFFWEGARPPISDEHRAKLSILGKQRKLSESHKQALHEGRRRSKNSPEHAAAVRASRIGTKHTEASKLKMSMSLKNNPKRSEISSKAGKASALARAEDNSYKEARRQQMKNVWALRKAGRLPMPAGKTIQQVGGK